MLLETHCHTAERSRCSRSPAAQIAHEALARRLHGVVFTDHHCLWSDRELADLRRDAGIPDHFLLLSGQEVSTADLGHVLVYGAASALPEGTPTAEIRGRFPDAALVRAHPYRHRLEYRLAQLAPPGIDGVEIFSGNHTMKANSRGLEDWHCYRFTALAGTDAHGQVPAGTYPTQFDHPVDDVGALAREIRRGRCRPFFKEIALSGANSLITEIVIGTKGENERRPRIVLRRFGRRADWERAVKEARDRASLAALGFDDRRYRIAEVLEIDAGRLTIIEEGLRARPLFEKMLVAGPAEGRACLELAAGWLARFHDLPPAGTPRPGFIERERRRLDGYAERFRAAGHPQADLVRALGAAVLRVERRLRREHPSDLVRCHGDYHPKNLVIGQDSLEDRATVFIAAIDLEDGLVGPRALDVGSFLAHYRHQLAPHPQVLAAFPPSWFLEAYLRQATPGGDVARQAGFFAARAQLSIAAYLVKLGLGDSDALAGLLRECRRAVEEFAT